jgi:hypothetical protein
MLPRRQLQGFVRQRVGLPTSLSQAIHDDHGGTDYQDASKKISESERPILYQAWSPIEGSVNRLSFYPPRNSVRQSRK